MDVIPLKSNRSLSVDDDVAITKCKAIFVAFHIVKRITHTEKCAHMLVVLNICAFNLRI